MAEQPGTRVTLSYRSAAFSRVKAKNRQRLDEMRASGTLEVLMESNVREIGVREVKIEQGDKTVARPNDAVIVCAGGELPTPLLRKIGIQFETKFGTR